MEQNLSWTPGSIDTIKLMQKKLPVIFPALIVLGKFFAILPLLHATSALFISAQAQPTISGRVANARTGLGILSVDLDVFDEQGNSVAISGGRSSTNGQFTISLPGAGRYIIRADPNASDFFVDQYFNGVFLPSQATSYP